MIPNLCFKLAIPEKIPPSMSKSINTWKKGASKRQFIKKCYDYLIPRHHGTLFNIIFRFPELYSNGVDKIWPRKGYLHCTTLNYLIRIMLVKSGLFKDSDIELKFTIIHGFIPHQYMKIWLSKNKFLYVDPWAYQLGIDFGERASGFNSSMRPVR